MAAVGRYVGVGDTWSANESSLTLQFGLSGANIDLHIEEFMLSGTGGDNDK